MVGGLSPEPDVAGEPVTVEVTAAVPHEPGTEWQGLLFVGPADAPSALIVPVTITVPEADTGELITRFSATPDALATGDTTSVSLWVWNHGASGEAVEVAIDVPAGLVVDPGSVQATAGQATFNIAGRSISWAGSLAGGEHVAITFDAAAATRTGMIEIEARVNGLSRPSEAFLSLPVWLNMAALERVILLPALLDD